MTEQTPLSGGTAPQTQRNKLPTNSPDERHSLTGFHTSARHSWKGYLKQKWEFARCHLLKCHAFLQCCHLGPSFLDPRLRMSLLHRPGVPHANTCLITFILCPSHSQDPTSRCHLRLLPNRHHTLVFGPQRSCSPRKAFQAQHDRDQGHGLPPRGDRSATPSQSHPPPRSSSRSNAALAFQAWLTCSPTAEFHRSSCHSTVQSTPTSSKGSLPDLKSRPCPKTQDKHFSSQRKLELSNNVYKTRFLLKQDGQTS